MLSASAAATPAPRTPCAPTALSPVHSAFACSPAPRTPCATTAPPRAVLDLQPSPAHAERYYSLRLTQSWTCSPAPRTPCATTAPPRAVLDLQPSPAHAVRYYSLRLMQSGRCLFPAPRTLCATTTAPPVFCVPCRSIFRPRVHVALLHSGPRSILRSCSGLVPRPAHAVRYYSPGLRHSYPT